MFKLSRGVLCACTCLLIAASQSQAFDIETKSEIESLKRRIDKLEGEAPREEKPFSIAALGRRLTFWGLVEIEAFYNKTEGRPESSDVIVATAQLAADLRITDNIGGHIVFLHEEDQTDLDVDEANIIIYCPKKFGGGTSGLIAGKFYLPFGNFSTNMITDPLTLDLGETNNTALVLNWKNETISANLGFFNGDADVRDDHDNIDSFVFSVDMNLGKNIAYGVSLISDLAESDLGLVDTGPPNQYTSDTPAGSAYIHLVFGQFAIIGEHVGALDEFNQEVIDPNGDLTGDKPWAINLGAAISITEQFGAAVRFEKADDFRNDMNRYGATVSYGIIDGAIVALEYLLTDPDNGDMSHTFTTQLAFKF